MALNHRDEDSQQRACSGSAPPEIVRYRHPPPPHVVNGGRRQRRDEDEALQSLSALQKVKATYNKHDFFSWHLSQGKAEVVRHHQPTQVVTPITSLPLALAQELEIARLKEEKEAAEAKAKEENMTRHSRKDAKDEASKSRERSNSLDMPREGEPEQKEPQQAEQNGDNTRQSSNESNTSHYHELRSHDFYLLHVHLRQGYDLAARDSNGSSDPYVKFLYKGKVQYKSKIIYKDLNPYWDEGFTLAIDDPFTPLHIKVSLCSKFLMAEIGVELKVCGILIVGSGHADASSLPARESLTR